MGEIAVAEAINYMPFSLYFDIKEGTQPDLEVVSRTSIALADAIRQIASIIDPSADVRLQFVSATPGSLSINTAISVYRQNRKIITRSLVAVALVSQISLASYIDKDALLDCIEKGDINILIEATAKKLGLAIELGKQKLANDSNDLNSTDEDEARRINEKAIDLIKRSGQSVGLQEIFREINTDKSITGIGVSFVHGKKPECIVQKEQFSPALSEAEHQTVSERTRTREAIETLRLVSPYLDHKAGKWRFSDGRKSFAVSMKDNVFLEKLTSGRILSPMVIGIRMEVLMQTTEKKKGVLWVVKSRSILNVRSINPPQTQYDLGVDLITSYDFKKQQTANSDN